MQNSRRLFLAALAATTAACRRQEQAVLQRDPRRAASLRHLAAVGPEVSTDTFAEAEKLVQFPLSPDRPPGRRQLAPQSRLPLRAPHRPPQTRPRSPVSPATVWNPTLPGRPPRPPAIDSSAPNATAVPLPTTDAAIAFAPVHSTLPLDRNPQTHLASASPTSTSIASQRFDPKLHCVITLTRDHALAQAKQAEPEIAAGQYRGPLHGIPWGAKDLLDTAGHPHHLRRRALPHRVPTADAAVVARLQRTPAPSSSPNSASARSPSTTSGSAARP